MSLFTKQQFFNVSNIKTGTKTFSAIVNESRRESRSSKTTSIFLSHCHRDKDIVNEAIAFFKGLGISIYVDWLDDTMPEKTSGITASNIKLKIINNDKFILLATNDAVSSKWCNWELGIGDILKTHADKIAILPLAENSGHWAGNEYLQIYPRIEAVNITSSSNNIYDNIFYVKYPNGTSKWLDNWLKQ